LRLFHFAKLKTSFKYRFTNVLNDMKTEWQAIKHKTIAEALRLNPDLKISNIIVQPTSVIDGLPTFKLMNEPSPFSLSNSLLVRSLSKDTISRLEHYLMERGGQLTQSTVKSELLSTADYFHLKVHLPVQFAFVSDRIKQLGKLLSEFPDSSKIQVLVASCPYWHHDPKVLLRQRAKISFIDRNGTREVEKQFYPIAQEFYERENKARNKLKSACIVPAIADKELCITTPYIEQIYTYKHGLFSYYDLRHARKIMAAVKEINKQGFALVDWNSDCFLIDSNHNVNIVDLEYCQETGFIPNDFTDSADYLGARQFGLKCPGRSECGYRDFWYPILGVRYQTLMSGSTTKIRMLQTLHFLHSRFPKRISLQIQNGVSAARKSMWYVWKKGRWIDV